MGVERGDSRPPMIFIQPATRLPYFTRSYQTVQCHVFSPCESLVRSGSAFRQEHEEFDAKHLPQDTQRTYGSLRFTSIVIVETPGIYIRPTVLYSSHFRIALCLLHPHLLRVAIFRNIDDKGSPYASRTVLHSTTPHTSSGPPKKAPEQPCIPYRARIFQEGTYTHR